MTASPTLGKDLTGLEHMTPEQIRLILDTAEPFKEVSERPIKKVPALRGKTIVNLFFEASTRTRISFEFAEKRLSADTVNVAASGSSVSKGETLVDTARNLEAMRIDMVVIRHPSSGAAEFLGNRIDSNVINAGDGKHEHPTQALLDLLTIRDKHGKIEGLKVCLVGDVLHSRVARSNLWGLTKLGAEVAVCGPWTLMPRGIEELGVKVFGRIEEAKLQRHAVRPYDDRELADSDTKKATPVSGGRYHFRLQASLSGLDEGDRTKGDLGIHSIHRKRALGSAPFRRGRHRSTWNTPSRL